MSANDFDYTWDDRMHNGMGGWRFEPKEEPKPSLDADDFLTALNKRLS